MVAIIVINDFSQQFAHLFAGKNPVATLATLILLSYAKLFRTVIAALSFAQLPYQNGSYETVWLLDADVPYIPSRETYPTVNCSSCHCTNRTSLHVCSLVLAAVNLMFYKTVCFKMDDKLKISGFHR